MNGLPVGEYSALVHKRKEESQLGAYCNTLEREWLSVCHG